MQGTYDNAATFVAGEAITRNARVRINTSGALVLAGANTPAIGVAEYAVADGEACTVRLYGSGTMQMIASEALTVGETVYGAASGKISDTTTGTTIIGQALEAAAADGDIIHVAPYGAEIAQ